jgi:hypothetical protein
MMNRNDAKAEHRQTWEAIPWVVNGSADEMQCWLVETHTRECETCRAELVHQRKVHGAMAQESMALTNPDVGLQRLLKRIDQAEADSARVSPVSARPSLRRPGARALVYGLTFALIVESIGISVLGMGLLSQSQTAPTQDYRTLSQPAAADARATIRIVPAPAMNLGDLQRLLQSLELQVVAGPNEAGAYALAPMSTTAVLDNQVARLRAAPGMRLVEPIRERETAR